MRVRTDFDVIPTQTQAALKARCVDLGLTRVTDHDLFMLAHAFWVEAQGGSPDLPFIEALSMDLRIPEAVIEDALSTASLDEAPVEDRILWMLDTYRSLTGLIARRFARRARRDVRLAAARRRSRAAS